MFFIFVLMLINVSFASYAGLTATTSQIINGQAPILIKDKPEDSIIFTSNGRNNISAALNNVPEDFAPYLLFNNFSASKELPNNIYLDDDGDEISSIYPAISAKNTELSWKDSSGKSVTNLAMPIGCSGYSPPYTLTITLKNIDINSQYGVPSTNEIPSLSREYTIAVGPGPCVLQPADLSYVALGTYPGGGYLQSFIPNLGFVFDPNAAIQFPSVGFPKAKFRWILSGSQSDYTFSSSANPANSLSINQSGDVLLSAKPIGTVSLFAKHKISGETFTHSFAIKNWVVPLPYQRAYKTGSTWPAAAACKGSAVTSEAEAQSLLAPRNIFSNSPGVKYSPGAATPTSVGTRAVDGTLYGEWGRVLDKETSGANASYPDSVWKWAGYLTSETHTPNKTQFVASPGNGNVYTTSWATGDYVACLK